MKSHILNLLPKGHPWAEHINYYPSAGSTNDLAKALAQQGAPQGTVCIAGSQTQGKGRMGRYFHSPDGKGLYFSLILRPNCPAQELMHLTCAVAVAACDAVEALCQRRPGIKWINDLVANGRKLGGILTELSLQPGTNMVNYAIVGIGINCLQEASDFPEQLQDMATSIRAAYGMAVSPAQLAAQLVLSLHNIADQLLCQKTAIMERYKKDCMTIDKQIRIVRAEEETFATALDIDLDGGLIARLDNGQTVTVSSGEVSVRGMYGYL